MGGVSSIQFYFDFFEFCKAPKTSTFGLYALEQDDLGANLAEPQLRVDPVL